jgi:hypothetical protein
VNTGTPQGTSGAPWLVALAGTTELSLANLAAAIGDSAISGTDYSLLLIGHATVTVSSNDATTVKIRANANGTGGNAIATTETGANLAWGATTLAGGGGSAFTAVAVPDGDGIISVAMTLSYIVAVVAQGFGKNGRFYWINPGEVTIEDLNFATAERAPDPTWNAVDAGDSVWFPGPQLERNLEPAARRDCGFPAPAGPPVRHRNVGRDGPQDQGQHARDRSDGTAYEIVGGEPVVISTPGVAERFRKRSTPRGRRHDVRRRNHHRPSGRERRRRRADRGVRCLQPRRGGVEMLRQPQ